MTPVEEPRQVGWTLINGAFPVHDESHAPIGDPLYVAVQTMERESNASRSEPEGET